MANDKAKRRAIKACQHSVVAICDAASNEIVAYRLALDRDGDIGTQIDAEKQYVRVVGIAPDHSTAKKLLKELETWSIKDIRAQAPTLQVFDDTLPENPRTRAAAFRSLPTEQQEEVIHRSLLRSGASLSVVSKWLHVPLDEVKELVDKDIVDAAQAEMQLRIGTAMLSCLDSNSPQALTGKIYLSKARLGWKDDGSSAIEAEQHDAPASLFDGLTVVEAHRDQNGTTIAEPTELQLQRTAD